MNAPTTLQPKADDQTSRKPLWKLLARLLILAGLLWLIATRLNLKAVTQALGQLNAAYLVPVVLVLVPATVLLRSVRWRWLLPAGAHLPLSRYVKAYLIGSLANSLLLGKLGDLVKARVICDSKVDYGRSVAVVLIDRLVEGIALLMIFAIVFLTSTLPAWAYRLAWLVGTTGLGALLALRIIVHHRESFLRLATAALRRLPHSPRDKALVLFQRLIAGCEVLADYRRLLVAFLYALAAWGVDVAIALACLGAFPIHVPWLPAAVLLVVVVNLGMLLPISPGSVGVYQFMCALGLALWGVSRGLAFALGVVMQATVFVPLYLGGLVCLLTMKWNNEKLKEQIQLGAPLDLSRPEFGEDLSRSWALSQDREKAVRVGTSTPVGRS